MGQRGTIVDALRFYQRVGFDTPIFIYHIEQTSPWADAAEAIIRALANGQVSGVTSSLTLLEISVKPLRLARPEIADAYEKLLSSIPNLAVANLDRPVILIAAELRAVHGLRTPDALQIAACLDHGAKAFVTNDRRLRRVTEIDVVMLSDFV